MPIPSQNNGRYGHLNASVNLRKQMAEDGAPEHVVKAFHGMDVNHHLLSNSLHGFGSGSTSGWSGALNPKDPKPQGTPNWEVTRRTIGECEKYAEVLDSYYQEPTTAQALVACQNMREAAAREDWKETWRHKVAYMDALVLFSWEHWDARTAGNDNPKWGRYPGEEPPNKWVVTTTPEVYLFEPQPEPEPEPEEEPVFVIVGADDIAGLLSDINTKLAAILEILQDETD